MMKKIYYLLFVAIVSVTAVNAQVIFQSNFNSWAGSPILPTDFVGPHTNLSTDSITQESNGTVYGNFAVELRNGSNSGKRFSTQPVSVTKNETYNVTYWVKGNGEVAARLWAEGYLGSVTYQTVNSNNWTSFTQTVISDTTVSNAEVLIYVKNTSTFVQIDSVVVEVATIPNQSIYDIQYSPTTGISAFDGMAVNTGGIVTAVRSSGYYIQSSASNTAWNGLYVYDNANNPSIGDSITLSGTVSEYYTLTELTSVGNYVKVSSGNPLPIPTNLTTQGVNDEQYEGVLVKVTNATCTSDTSSNNYKEWVINDGSGGATCDDIIFEYGPVLSTAYNVTGVIDYSFSKYRLLPRDINDISVFSSVVENVKDQNIAVYPNPTKSQVVVKLENNANKFVLFDVTGKEVKSVNLLSLTTNVDLTNLNSGVYFYSIVDNNTVIKTDKLIITK